LKEYLRVTFSYGHQIAYGLILVVVVLFMPEGLLGSGREGSFRCSTKSRKLLSGAGVLGDGEERKHKMSEAALLQVKGKQAIWRSRCRPKRQF